MASERRGLRVPRGDGGAERRDDPPSLNVTRRSHPEVRCAGRGLRAPVMRPPGRRGFRGRVEVAISNGEGKIGMEVPSDLGHSALLS